MRDDEDALAAYDLTAWEAPPPPASLVDGVIARARETSMPALISVEERAPRVKAMESRPSWSRWWIIGGVAAATAAAAIALGVWGIEHAPSSRDAAVQAEVDKAMEDVAGLVKQIEALNQEREVLLRNIQQTCDEVWCVLTNFEAGCCDQFEALQRELEEVDRQVTRAIDDVEQAKNAYDAVGVVDPLEIEPLPGGPATPAPNKPNKPNKPVVKKTTPAMTCDEVSCVLNNYEGGCCDRFKKGYQPNRVVGASPPSADDLPDGLDRFSITKAVDGIMGEVNNCGPSFTGNMKMIVNVAPSGNVRRLDVVGPEGKNDPPDVAACIHAAALKMVFPKTRGGGAFSYPLRFANASAAGAAPTSPTMAGCDASARNQDGVEAASLGDWREAAKQFEAALRCKPDEVTRKRAFVAACNIGDTVNAKRHFKDMSKVARDELLPSCMRFGIDPSSPTSCDGTEDRKRGEELLATGMDAAALAKLEASLSCKDDLFVRRLAVLAACRAKNVASARRHYASLPAPDPDIAMICTRSNVVLDAPKPQPARAQAAQGTLDVMTMPAGQISVDGIAVGQAPLTMSLPAGRHKMTVVTPDRKATFTVEVKAGETLKVVKDLR